MRPRRFEKKLGSALAILSAATFGSEGPVFFERGGILYIDILPGTGCCGCLGGSNMYVFISTSPMGPFVYRGDSGSNTTAPFDTHSPWNYPTRAQASAAVKIAGSAGHATNKSCGCYGQAMGDVASAWSAKKLRRLAVLLAARVHGGRGHLAGVVRAERAGVRLMNTV